MLAQNQHLDRIQIDIPASVNPKDYLTYDECKDEKYSNLPETIPEPIHRRIAIAVNHFPGPIIVDGREEFYVESIYKQLKYADNRNDAAFIVIWAGWPAIYATIEPMENFANCVALDLFEASKNGYLIGTGSHKNVRVTAVRSIKRTNSPTVKNDAIIWPSDQLDNVFQNRIELGTYKKTIGFVCTGRRIQLFEMELQLWQEVHHLLSCKRQSIQCYISPTFYGNYFGKGKRQIEIKNIDSKKLEDSWSVIMKELSARLNAMTYTDGAKFCILLFVSQIGEMNAKMNDAVVEGESYKTHCCVLVARERIAEKEKVERDYFWYEPTYHAPTTPYKPMKFLLTGKLGYKNVVNLIFGHQVDSHDCLYRCMRWIDNVLNGNVSFDGPYRQYNFKKRLGPQ